MEKHVELHCKSVYDEELPAMLRKGAGAAGGFAAVYFSGSFSLLPDPAAALDVALSLLAPGGLIYITQTYQKGDADAAPTMLRVLKPLLFYVTTIDFGQLVYEVELEATLRAHGGLHVLHNGVIAGSVDNRFQSARLVVLQRAAGAGGQ